MATSRIATQPRVSRSKKSANSPHEVPNDPMLAQARAVADTIHQLERGHVPKAGVKLPLFNKDGTDFASPPPPARPDEGRAHPVSKPAPTRRSTDSSLPDLERHRRKCIVCNHPEREAIEEAFLHWHSPDYIANEFHFDDGRYLRRHAHALGLYSRRRENHLFTLENLLERGDEIELTASAYIKAVRAYACMCDTVRWTEPAIRVIGVRDSSAPSRDRVDNEEQLACSSTSLPEPATKITSRKGTASAVPSVQANSGASAPEGMVLAPPSPDSQPSLCSGRSAAGGPGTPLFDGASPRESVEETVPSSLLPQATSNNPACGREPAPQEHSGIQFAGSASLLPQAAVNEPVTAKLAPQEHSGIQVVGSASLLPQAAVNKPVTTKPAPSGFGLESSKDLTELALPSTSLPQAPQEHSGIQVAGSASLLPQAVVNEPVTAKPAPSGFGLESSKDLTESALPSTSLPQAASEISASSALLHNAQEPKDAEPRSHSSLVTRHSSLPSNRPSPRLETPLTDTKQRKEAHSNRPQNAK